MRPFVLFLSLLFVLPVMQPGKVVAEPQKTFDTSDYSVSNKVEPEKVKGRDSFRRELISAAKKAAAKGDISRRDLIKLRIASFSPAFVERAEELCVVQMAMSGEDSDALPMDEDGNIVKTAIDWEAFAAFLERILPLILQILAAFGLGL